MLSKFNALVILVITSFLQACAAIPIATITGSNLLVKQHYQNKYDAYDSAYRLQHDFIEHLIPRNGHKLYAREFRNPTQTSSSKAVILMHGFPDSLHLYDSLAPLLAKNERVISFDFIGWGKSDKPLDHTYHTESLYRDLEAVIEHFRLEQVTLVAHDSSGPPAIEWALNNENKMQTLVLLNTYYHPMEALVTPEAIVLFSQPGFRRTITRTGAWISNYGWSRGYRNQLEKFFYSDTQRELFVPVFTLQAMGIKNAFFELNEALPNEARKRAANIQKLSAYEKPVRIIFGKEDPYLNVAVAKNFNQIFPNSELFLVNASAHYVQLDQPEYVAEQILNAQFTISWFAD